MPRAIEPATLDFLADAGASAASNASSNLDGLVLLDSSPTGAADAPSLGDLPMLERGRPDGRARSRPGMGRARATTRSWR